MSMNKDLVAQAVAAIPLWLAFLDQKEAEQDALLEEMKNGAPKTLMQKATSLLKKKPQAPASEEVQTGLVAQTAAPASVPPLLPSTHDQRTEDAVRWAPKEEDDLPDIGKKEVERGEEEEERVEREEEEELPDLKDLQGIGW